MKGYFLAVLSSLCITTSLNAQIDKKLPNAKVQREPPASVLKALRFTTPTSDNILRIVKEVKMMMDNSYTVDELIPAIRSVYHASINELTYIIYRSYYETKKGRIDPSPWAKDFQSKIMKAFGSKEISLEQLLYNSYELWRDPPPGAYTLRIQSSYIFAYQYFYLKTKGSSEEKVTLFENLANVGYDPSLIYYGLLLDTWDFSTYNFEEDFHRHLKWTPFYCQGMKKSSVRAGEVVKALQIKDDRSIAIAYTKEEIIKYLRDAGYTPAEVLEGMRSYSPTPHAYP
jgi:hypothetical protein